MGNNNLNIAPLIEEAIYQSVVFDEIFAIGLYLSYSTNI